MFEISHLLRRVQAWEQDLSRISLHPHGSALTTPMLKLDHVHPLKLVKCRLPLQMFSQALTSNNAACTPLIFLRWMFIQTEAVVHVSVHCGSPFSQLQKQGAFISCHIANPLKIIHVNPALLALNRVTPLIKTKNRLLNYTISSLNFLILQRR